MRYTPLPRLYRCSRQHNRPVFSTTAVIPHMYDNPVAKVMAVQGDLAALDMEAVDRQFEEFYEEVFDELSQHGRLEEVHVLDNLGDHMVGNVYVKFRDEEDTAACQRALMGKYFAGKPLKVELCPVTDFREARCRQFDEGACDRAGFCNFMHIKKVDRGLLRELEDDARRTADRLERDSSSDGSSRSGSSRSRSRSRDGSTAAAPSAAAAGAGAGEGAAAVSPGAAPASKGDTDQAS